LTSALLSAGCGGEDASNTGLSEEALQELGLSRTTPPRLRAACEKAARESTLTVYCPPVVPGGGKVTGVQFVAPFDRTVRGGRKLRAVPVPASYRAHLNSPALDRTSIGHWAFEAGPPKPIDAVLSSRSYGVDPGDAITSSRRLMLAGTEAEVLRMARYPIGGIHGGHVVVRWEANGVTYLVSVHGDGNEERALAVAAGLIELVRDCPTAQDLVVETCS
jgi:hypothetical protein